jgi:hypothetical protein
MSTHKLKLGDRVRVTASGRPAGCQPGDKGTVALGPMNSAGDALYYFVSMDKDGAASTTILFRAGDIEPDV